MLPLTTPVLRIGLVCIGTPCRALRTWPLSCRALLPSHSFRRPLPGLTLGVRLLRQCRCRGGQAELSVSRVCCTHPFCGSRCGLHLCYCWRLLGCWSMMVNNSLGPSRLQDLDRTIDVFSKQLLRQRPKRLVVELLEEFELFTHRLGARAEDISAPLQSLALARHRGGRWASLTTITSTSARCQSRGRPTCHLVGTLRAIQTVSCARPNDRGVAHEVLHEDTATYRTAHGDYIAGSDAADEQLMRRVRCKRVWRMKRPDERLRRPIPQPHRRNHGGTKLHEQSCGICVIETKLDVPLAPEVLD